MLKIQQTEGAQAWWHTSLIPALRSLRPASSQSEFQDSQGKIERLCLKINEINQLNK